MIYKPEKFSGPQAAYDDFKKAAEIPVISERWARLAFMAGVAWSISRQRSLGEKIVKTALRYLP